MKKTMAMLLSIIMLSVGVCLNVTAASSTGTKTAKLNNAKVTFNGVEHIIQCYNIENRNYVRIRDVVAPFDIQVEAMVYNGKQTGVNILSYMNYEGTPGLEPLTEQSITVTVTKGNLYYDGISTEVEQFNYGNRNYYRLVDIMLACENSLVLAEELAIRNGNYIQGELRTYNPFRTIDVKWNAATNIIECTSTLVDLTQLAKDTREIALGGGEQATAPPMSVGDSPVRPTSLILHAPMPEMTSPPAEGAILAKILKDSSLGVYVDGDPKKAELLHNFHENYLTHIAIGQCTWYATGRLAEVTGINLYALPTKSLYEADEVAKQSNGLLAYNTKAEDITARSVAIFYGHVVFVEYVERDSVGNPIYVYFTEANNGNDGIYRPEIDGAVKKLSFENFAKRQGGVLGYLSVK